MVMTSCLDDYVLNLAISLPVNDTQPDYFLGAGVGVTFAASTFLKGRTSLLAPFAGGLLSLAGRYIRYQEHVIDGLTFFLELATRGIIPITVAYVVGYSFGSFFRYVHKSR